MRCLITFKDSNEDYSTAGLRKLHRNLAGLQSFPYSAEEQLQQAVLRAKKMSVQGVQPKLSAVLNVKEQSFDVVDQFGTYIIKPPNREFPEMPENEALTMRLAQLAGIETPLHGLLRCCDGSLSYMVKRFDRLPRGRKQHMEDFAQASERTRSTKYDSSMEKVADILEYCTFPAVARMELFKRSLFNFITGNEDMHLKNFSLIYRKGRCELAPGYDLLNSALVWRLLGRPVKEIEELALPLAGKRRRLNREDWFEYFGKKRLQLTDAIIARCWKSLAKAADSWFMEIERSFLSAEAKDIYAEMVGERLARLDG